MDFYQQEIASLHAVMEDTGAASGSGGVSAGTGATEEDSAPPTAPRQHVWARCGRYFTCMVCGALNCSTLRRALPPCLGPLGDSKRDRERWRKRGAILNGLGSR